ncbi:hypothetical protein TUM17580_42070 [Citrobacter farmeri]|nr:hypothetical protein TUM17580_42070 [Citrobacter farmeri]
MKLQNRDTLRQTKGTGSRSFTSPARMMGTEHKMVTTMVDAMLSNRVTAASNLIMIKLFKGLAINSTLKSRKGADFIRK